MFVNTFLFCENEVKLNVEKYSRVFEDTNDEVHLTIFTDNQVWFRWRITIFIKEKCLPILEPKFYALNMCISICHL